VAVEYIVLGIVAVEYIVLGIGAVEWIGVEDKN
jgi:hypothetical protein